MRDLRERIDWDKVLGALAVLAILYHAGEIIEIAKAFLKPEDDDVIP
jgi:hypothetical protein